MHQICIWIKLLSDLKQLELIDINASVIDNLKAVAKAKNKNIEDVVVTILNRERHARYHSRNS